MKIIILVLILFFVVFLSAIADELWSLIARNSRRSNKEDPRSDDVFFEVVFSLLGKIAKADGYVSADEIQVVEDFMENVLRLTPESRARAIRIFRGAKDDTRTIRDIASRFFSSYHRQPVMLRRLVDLLFAVAHADQNFSIREEELIREVLGVFGMNPRGYRVWKEPVSSDSKSGPYSVLGCNPGDPQEVVRRRYRELALRFHPDRLAGKGKDNSFREFATAKFREIQNAYTEIKRERGWA